MIYAFTGHRPNRLGSRDPAVYMRLIDLFMATFEIHAPDIVITGLAEGADQAMADACWLSGVPYWAYLPCIDQCRYWSKEAIIKYEDLLHKANRVELIYNGYYADNKRCYIQRDYRMVDDSSGVISLYCGDPESGTGKTVIYAEKLHRPIIKLWQSWERYK